MRRGLNVHRFRTTCKVTVTWLALQLAATGALAAQSGIESLVPVRPTGMVTDQAGLLTPPMLRTIDDRLVRLRQVTGAEVAVVTLPSIGDQAAVDVTTAIGRSWGVGGAFPIGDARRNAAAVLLVVPRTSEHGGEVFVGSGSGAEGFLTDARAGQIRDAMLPALRDGDYDQAIEIGTALLSDLFARELGSTDSTLIRPEDREERGSGLVVLILIVILIVAILAVMSDGRGGGGPRGPGSGFRRRSRGSMLGPMIWGGMLGGGSHGGFGGGGGFSGGGAGGRF
ncbi:MAG: TPM domain-containing protein [Gemmatimonadota bacterium]